MQFYFEGEKDLENFKQQADGFVCSNHPQSPYHQVHMSPGKSSFLLRINSIYLFIWFNKFMNCKMSNLRSGGLIHLRDGANSQYVTGTAFLFSAYSDYLAKYKKTVSCGNKQFNSADLMAFAKQQVGNLFILVALS